MITRDRGSVGEDERETMLKRGLVERYAKKIFLYWELAREEGDEIPQGYFTIDLGPERHRYKDLADADKKMQELLRQHAMEIASQALGLD